MNKQHIQQDELNGLVKTKVAPSPISGVGVFALRDIAKGHKLNVDMYPRMYNLSYSNFSKLFPEVREYLLERWPEIVNGSNFIYPDTRIQAFMNHSDDPNYDAKADVLLRDVKAGEEITEDYRKIEGWEKIFTWLEK